MKTVRYLVIVLIACALPACAFKSSVKTAYAQGFAAADGQCVQLQSRLQAYMSSEQIKKARYEERLLQLGEMNPDGSLHYKNQATPVPSASVTPTPSPSPVQP